MLPHIWHLTILILKSLHKLQMLEFMVLEFPFNVAWSVVICEEHNLYNQDSNTAVYNDYKVVHFKLQNSDKVAWPLMLCCAAAKCRKKVFSSGTCLC